VSSGLLFGLLAALAWGIGDTMTAVLGRRLGSIRTVAGIQLVSVLVLGAFLVVTQTAIPVDPAVLVPIVAIGVLASISYVVFVEALRRGPLTVVSPVVAAYGGGTAILAVFVLGEQPGVLRFVGVGITTLGVVLTSIVVDRSARTTRFGGPGVPLAIVALVTFAFVTVATSWAIRSVGWLPVAFVARFVNNALVWSFIGGQRLLRPSDAANRGARARTRDGLPEGALPESDLPESDLRQEEVVDALLAAEGSAVSGGLPAHLVGRGLLAHAGAATLLMLVLSGLCDVGGYMAFAFGLQVSLAWLVGLASSLGPIVVVTLGILAFGERPRLNQYAGFACVLVGLVVLAGG
jgi:drug/metabolite transporter (DMT)-like permease